MVNPTNSPQVIFLKAGVYYFPIFFPTIVFWPNLRVFIMFWIETLVYIKLTLKCHIDY